MRAEFTVRGTNTPELVVEPELQCEQVLMAAFLRYDQNLFTVYVERNDAGLITEVRFSATGE